MNFETESDVFESLAAGGPVLVTRLQHVGDVILTLPLVQALKRRFPRIEIDYLARGPAAEILSGEPSFATVFRLPERAEGVRASLRLIVRLRRRNYAAAIDLYSNPRSAAITLASGARVRIGGARRLRRHFYTNPVQVPPTIREATEHHLYYLRPLGLTEAVSKPLLHISEPERQSAARVFDGSGGRGRRLRIGLHPGGKWEVKRWPIPFFGRLAQGLMDKLDAQVFVFCGPGEESYRDGLRSELGESAIYLPTLPLRTTAAVIENLDAVVVPDGGIMHISVAVGTPTVGIFGSSEHEIWFPYERFGPYRAAHVPITCRPCHSHVCDHLSCLKRLTVDMVEEKVLAVLKLNASARAAATS